jgi:hypothetical protein
MKPRRVVVNDGMQRGYSYFLTEPTGRNYEPGFEPQLTPREMLLLGVFGGKYLTDCRAEFPTAIRHPPSASVRQRKRHERSARRCAVLPTAAGDDDVLLAVHDVERRCRIA